MNFDQAKADFAVQLALLEARIASEPREDLKQAFTELRDTLLEVVGSAEREYHGRGNRGNRKRLGEWRSYKRGRLTTLVFMLKGEWRCLSTFT